MAAREHYSYEDDYLPPATDDLVGPWEVTDKKDFSIGKKKKLRKG